MERYWLGDRDQGRSSASGNVRNPAGRATEFGAGARRGFWAAGVHIWGCADAKGRARGGNECAHRDDPEVEAGADQLEATTRCRCGSEEREVDGHRGDRDDDPAIASESADWTSGCANPIGRE